MGPAAWNQLVDVCVTELHKDARLESVDAALVLESVRVEADLLKSPLYQHLAQHFGPQLPLLLQGLTRNMLQPLPAKSLTTLIAHAQPAASVAPNSLANVNKRTGLAMPSSPEATEAEPQASSDFAPRQREELRSPVGQLSEPKGMTQGSPPPANSSKSASKPLIPGGPCENPYCGVMEAPQWRRIDKRLVCNRCGMYFHRHARFPDWTYFNGLANKQALRLVVETQQGGGRPGAAEGPSPGASDCRAPSGTTPLPPSAAADISASSVASRKQQQQPPHSPQQPYESPAPSPVTGPDADARRMPPPPAASVSPHLDVDALQQLQVLFTERLKQHQQPLQQHRFQQSGPPAPQLPSHLAPLSAARSTAPSAGKPPLPGTTGTPSPECRTSPDSPVSDATCAPPPALATGLSGGVAPATAAVVVTTNEAPAAAVQRGAARAQERGGCGGAAAGQAAGAAAAEGSQAASPSSSYLLPKQQHQQQHQQQQQPRQKQQRQLQQQEQSCEDVTGHRRKRRSGESSGADAAERFVLAAADDGPRPGHAGGPADSSSLHSRLKGQATAAAARTEDLRAGVRLAADPPVAALATAAAPRAHPLPLQAGLRGETVHVAASKRRYECEQQQRQQQLSNVDEPRGRRRPVREAPGKGMEAEVKPAGFGASMHQQLQQQQQQQHQQQNQLHKRPRTHGAFDEGGRIMDTAIDLRDVDPLALPEPQRLLLLQHLVSQHRLEQQQQQRERQQEEQQQQARQAQQLRQQQAWQQQQQQQEQQHRQQLLQAQEEQQQMMVRQRQLLKLELEQQLQLQQQQQQARGGGAHWSLHHHHHQQQQRHRPQPSHQAEPERSLLLTRPAKAADEALAHEEHSRLPLGLSPLLATMWQHSSQAEIRAAQAQAHAASSTQARGHQDPHPFEQELQRQVEKGRAQEQGAPADGRVRGLAPQQQQQQRRPSAAGPSTTSAAAAVLPGRSLMDTIAAAAALQQQQLQLTRQQERQKQPAQMGPGRTEDCFGAGPAGRQPTPHRHVIDVNGDAAAGGAASAVASDVGGFLMRDLQQRALLAQQQQQQSGAQVSRPRGGSDCTTFTGPALMPAAAVGAARAAPGTPADVVESQHLQHQRGAVQLGASTAAASTAASANSASRNAYVDTILDMLLARGTAPAGGHSRGGSIATAPTRQPLGTQHQQQQMAVGDSGALARGSSGGGGAGGPSGRGPSLVSVGGVGTALLPVLDLGKPPTAVAF